MLGLLSVISEFCKPEVIIEEKLLKLNHVGNHPGMKRQLTMFPDNAWSQSMNKL
jgi:hypothetical protein